jgi:nucleoside-diphosphate-sugar epimerase
MKDKVLITGASGFLGYHLVQSAVEAGMEVFAAVRKNSNIDHLSQFPLKYLFLNYEDPEQMSRLIAENKIDFIVHSAGVTKAIRQQDYDQVNAAYTINLAKAAENAGGICKKIVFISSLAAVGPLNDVQQKLTEQSLPHPVTAYGRSKLLAENELAKISIPTTILRPTAIYGPRDKDIFIMLKTINNGMDPFIGKIFQQLSFVHAKDVATAAVNSLLLKNAVGIYHITDGNCYNRYEFSDISKTILQRKAFRFHIPLPLVKSLAFLMEKANSWLNKPSVINREKLQELAAINWICDISKANKELNFTPQFNLKSGLEDTIGWYKKNKWL